MKIIDEEAYLSREEENEVMEFAFKNIEEKKMTLEEEEYLKGFPVLRLFAQTYVDTLGEDEYKKLEKENIKLIKTKVWKNG